MKISPVTKNSETLLKNLIGLTESSQTVEHVNVVHDEEGLLWFGRDLSKNSVWEARNVGSLRLLLSSRILISSPTRPT